MHTRLSPIMLGCFSLVVAAACNSVTGLNDFSVEAGSTQQAQCTTNADCMGPNAMVLGAGGESSEGNAICVKATGACVEVESTECKTITGDVTDDRAILFGSLFATTGAQGTTNLQRQQSAQLAVEQINAVGGIPTPSGN